jgi:hypothetical protein
LPLLYSGNVGLVPFQRGGESGVSSEFHRKRRLFLICW